jgi:hypothetical protein
MVSVGHDRGKPCHYYTMSVASHAVADSIVVTGLALSGPSKSFLDLPPSEKKRILLSETSNDSERTILPCMILDRQTRLNQKWLKPVLSLRVCLPT